MTYIYKQFIIGTVHHRDWWERVKVHLRSAMVVKMVVTDGWNACWGPGDSWVGGGEGYCDLPTDRGRRGRRRVCHQCGCGHAPPVGLSSVSCKDTVGRQSADNHLVPWPPRLGIGSLPGLSPRLFHRCRSSPRWEGGRKCELGVETGVLLKGWAGWSYQLGYCGSHIVGYYFWEGLLPITIDQWHHYLLENKVTVLCSIL